MSEMLANQYFIARKFKEAVRELEAVLQDNPDNQYIIKKLIICYTQVGRINESLDLFYRVIQDDPFLIIDTDVYGEDCPCPDIVEKMKKERVANTDSVNFHNIMGVLYLYCDIEESIRYFKESVRIEPNQLLINSIIKILYKIR